MHIDQAHLTVEYIVIFPNPIAIKMKLSNCILLLGGSLVLSNCGTYMPAKVDEKTGLYEGGASLEASNIRKRQTDIDLSKYRYVYLEANTETYPSRFEFYVREALFRAGFKRVLNDEELTNMVAGTPKLSSLTRLYDSDTLNRLAELSGPVLRINYTYHADGRRGYASLEVYDLETHEMLFNVRFDKFVWSSAEVEVHQPVFNELKRWVDDCNRNKKGASI